MHAYSKLVSSVRLRRSPLGEMYVTCMVIFFSGVAAGKTVSYDMKNARQSGLSDDSSFTRCGITFFVWGILPG